ncbi:MAG: type II toxin-antitoxin system Phd/YefM family antitoxin, partial [Desulfobacterales bacterium]
VWLNSRAGRLRVHDKISSQFWALRRPPGKARKRSILFLTNNDFSLTGHNEEVNYDLNYGQPTKRLKKMKTLSLSEAKMKLSEIVDSVQSTDEEIVITRNGRPAAVLISPDEFESWKETLAIKADQDLMEEIRTGLKTLKKRSRLYTLEELVE